MRTALGDLVAAGLVASDGFGGLRSIVRASGGRPAASGRANVTGRWSLLGSGAERGASREAADRRSGDAGGQIPDRAAAVEAQARALLRRYGIVFRRLLAREANVAPWRELTRVYRRLEARGEIRGGRFVTGMSGEQFALSDAVDRLREIRRTAARRALHRDQRGRSAEPRRDRHRRRSRPRSRRRRACSTATACRWRRWKAIMCDH